MPTPAWLRIPAKLPRKTITAPIAMIWLSHRDGNIVRRDHAVYDQVHGDEIACQLGAQPEIAAAVRLLLIMVHREPIHADTGCGRDAAASRVLPG